MMATTRIDARPGLPFIDMTREFGARVSSSTALTPIPSSSPSGSGHAG
jgi:hypothetical protein